MKKVAVLPDNDEVVDHEKICDGSEDDEKSEFIAPLPGEIVFDVSDEASDEVGVVQSKENGVDRHLHRLGVFGHPLEGQIPVVCKPCHDTTIVLGEIKTIGMIKLLSSFHHVNGTVTWDTFLLDLTHVKQCRFYIVKSPFGTAASLKPHFFSKMTSCNVLNSGRQ